MRLRFNTGTGAWEIEAYGAWTPARYSPDQIRQGILSGALQLVNPGDPGVPGRLASMGIPVDSSGAVQPQPTAQQAQVPAAQLQGALGRNLPAGATLTPEGAMVRGQPAAGGSATIPPLVGNGQPLPPLQGLPATATAAPAPPAPPATDPANPGLQWNPQTQSYHQTQPTHMGGQPTASAAAPSAPPPPPVFNPAEGMTPEQQQQLMQQQGGQPGDFRSVDDYYALLGGTPELRRFAEGGMMDEMTPTPNAITGEGMETETAQFDQPYRGEVVLMPTGKPGNYDVRYTEGPVASALKPKSLIIPLPDSLEEEMHRELLPLEATPLKDTGDGSLVDVTGQAYATGGVVPAPSLMAPSVYPDVWAGLQNTGWGNLQGYLSASDMALKRRDQELNFGGDLGGAQAARQRFAQLAPPMTSLGTYS